MLFSGSSNTLVRYVPVQKSGKAAAPPLQGDEIIEK
jgi:hypothetical protein